MSESVDGQAQHSDEQRGSDSMSVETDLSSEPCNNSERWEVIATPAMAAQTVALLQSGATVPCICCGGTGPVVQVVLKAESPWLAAGLEVRRQRRAAARNQ